MADIVIRGMKVPRGCFECPFDRFGDVRDRVTSCWLKTEREGKCPLAPLPEGHWNLIDQNELLSRLGAWINRTRRSFSDDELIIVNAMYAGVKDSPIIIGADKEGPDNEQYYH